MPAEPLRVWNPPNPYLTDHRELLGEPPSADLEIYEDSSRTILSTNDSPDLGFRFSVNPYRGCFHACSYCSSGDTPILLADGRSKLLADLQVGDAIYGTAFNGRSVEFVKTKVLARWKSTKAAYRITLKNGTQPTASAEHRFLTSDGWKHVFREKGKRAKKGCSFLTTKDELVGMDRNGAQLSVVSIENLGISMEMYDITTGTGDFIANGVVSHNCYARRTHEYFGLGAGTDFERKIFVKKDAPKLLEEAFQRPSWKGGHLVFSGVTDCYQPLEAAWELTRGCLEVCLKYRNSVSIITKSALIRRDVDILQGLRREASVRVNLSIAFLDDQIARLVEPGTPTIEKRFETMKILADAGIPVNIGVAPIIPGLNDRDVAGLLRRAKECGATGAFHTLLRLPGSVKDVFLHGIAERLPLKYEHIRKRILDVRDGKMYDSRFFERRRGHGAYWDVFDKSWDVWVKRFGLDGGDDEEEERKPTFRRPIDRKGQIQFDWTDTGVRPLRQSSGRASTSSGRTGLSLY